MSTSSTIFLDTGTLPHAFNSYTDIISDLWSTNQQALVKTAKLTLEWAKVISSSLPSYSSFSNALSVLTIGDDIFTLTDAAGSVSALKKATINYFEGQPNTISFCIEATADVVNSVCEVMRWLHTFSIVKLTSKVFNRVCFVSGLSMMVGCGTRVYTFVNQAQNAEPYKKSYFYWETLKNTSLFALGFFYAASTLITLSPLFLLASSSLALIATYGSRIARNTQSIITEEKAESGYATRRYSVAPNSSDFVATPSAPYAHGTLHGGL
jgi:hypothetical protein